MQDLLKEAIADAKAVKETAIANAKLALEEAFTPRIQSMISSRLAEEEMEGEEEEMSAEPEMGDAGQDVGDLSIDIDQDGQFDEFDIMSKAGAEMPAEEMPAEDEYAAEEEDELNLESIIAELEQGMESEDDLTDVPPVDAVEEGMYEEDAYAEEDELANESIDALIEAILAEEDEMPAEDEAPVEEGKYKEMEKELQEAYRTVKQLQSVINEVNLLNAKLLYTNKLFRNFELNEAQKMKVIENFDRAATTREAKLVFATLAESFNKPTKARKVVKESKSYASRPVASTAPKTQILNEGFEYANRWKKLAGLI